MSEIDDRRTLSLAGTFSHRWFITKQWHHNPMNGLERLNSNHGAKNRLHVIPLDRSVYSCEAGAKSVPQFRILIKFRHPPCHTSLVASEEPRSSRFLTRPGWISSFDLVTRFTHDPRWPEPPSTRAPSLTITTAVSDGRTWPPGSTAAEAEMMPAFDRGSKTRRSVQSEALRSCSCHKKWQVPLIKGSTASPRPATSACAARCRFTPGPSVGPRDPQSCHSCQNDAPQSPRECWLLRYDHVFHQTRVILSRFMEYVQWNAWEVVRVKGHRGSQRGIFWSANIVVCLLSVKYLLLLLCILFSHCNTIQYYSI